jgi:hypothetical protein
MRLAGHIARKDDRRDTEFWCLNLREIHHLEGPGVDGRIILKWIFNKWGGDLERIFLAHNKDMWLVLVNAVMNSGFLKIRGIS